MNLVRDQRASVIVEEQEEEDRISRLPDDIIHRILSFLDIKYAIQTSALSKKWKYLWTLMPQLNFDSRLFSSIYQYAIFVKHALSHRNNRTQVSAVELTYTGAANHFFVRSIVSYAYLHNVRQLKITLFTKKHTQFQYLSSSRTLKHLTIVFNHHRAYGCNMRNATWDFPALETLNLRYIELGDGDKTHNLFSKCLNLKDLTLHQCSSFHSQIFNLRAPKLSSLTITGSEKLGKIFNVVASHLENLTLTIKSTTKFNFLELSPEGFNYIEKVNLSLEVCRNANETYLPMLFELFQKLRSVKYLILDWKIIETLSSSLNQRSHEPCPFDNLKCLKIHTSDVKQNNRIPTITTQVKNYFLENSPNASFIMDLPQLSQKRSMGQVNNEAMTNNVTNLEAEKSQPDTMTKEKRLLGAKIRMQDEVISEQQAINKTHLKQNDCIPTTTPTQVQNHLLENSPDATFIMDLPQVSHKRSLEPVHNELTTAKKVAKLGENVQMQDDVIADQKAKIQMQDEVNAKQKALFETKIQVQDRVIADQKAKIQMQDKIITDQKAKIQMQDEVIAMQKAMFEAKIQMQDEVIAEHKAKIQMQDKVIADQKSKIQMLEATTVQHEKLMSHIIKCKIAELKLQVESGNPDYQVIRLIGCDIKSAMNLIPESLRVVMEAQFSFQYVELKNLLLTRIDASQWANIETELGNTRYSPTSHCQMATSSSIVRLGSA